MKPVGLIQLMVGLVIVSLLGSCQITKHLPDNQLLYSKTEIILPDSPKLVNANKIENELVKIAPKTNNRTKLWLYNFAGKLKREKGIRFWIKNKLGESPKLFEELKIERSRQNMHQYLRNQGYFGSQVMVDTIVKARKVTGVFQVYATGRYLIRNVVWPDTSSQIGKQINSYQERTLIQSGLPYDQSLLVDERERITFAAGEDGYFKFSTSNLYYFIDTLPNIKKVDVYIQLQEGIDSSIYETYFLHETKIYDHYDILKPEANAQFRVLHSGGKAKATDDEEIKLKVLDRFIHQNQGDLYSRSLQNRTINNLLDLGVFKFVNLKYDIFHRQDTYWLDRRIFLTPGLPENVGVDLELNTRTGNFLGSSVAVHYQNTNTFRGAENLLIQLSGGIETQFGSGLSFVNSLEWLAEVNLSIPNIIFPVPLFTEKATMIPRSQIRISNHFQRRRGFFTTNSTNLALAYEWPISSRKKHNLGLISINHSRTFNKDVEFAKKLETNPRLKASFSNVFILSSYYQYLWQNGNPQRQGNATYFLTKLESAGNIPFLLFGISSRMDRPYTLFQSPFSQYLKADFDYRLYSKRSKSTWVYRGVAGWVFSYGNADYAPYVKQYFAGGSTELRAFRIRSVGPGSVPNTENEDPTAYFDQTGEVKLGFNVEYRFPLNNYLKGALFLDAGNIWLIQAREGDAQAGVFQLNRFYKEIAMGTGFGLRLDLNFFVLRLDISFPIINPGYSQGEKWLLPDVQFFNRSWRKDNLYWNLAIGYPF